MGCEASVRSALTAVDGISDLETDVASRTAKFKVSGDLDIKAKLDEIASTNQHVAGYTMLD